MKIQILDKHSTDKYIHQIAEIHSQAYSSEHFTAGFSPAKLSEYNKQLILASDISIIALDGENLAGFILAGENISSGVRNFTDQNRLWLIFQLLKRPIIFMGKMAALIQSKVSPTKPSQAKFRLLSIAIRPSAQSKGIGARMLAFLETELAQRNIYTYGLSVKQSNIGAIRFYEQNGFTLEKSFLGSSYYVKHINKKQFGV